MLDERTIGVASWPTNQLGLLLVEDEPALLALYRRDDDHTGDGGRLGAWSSPDGGRDPAADRRSAAGARSARRWRTYARRWTDVCRRRAGAGGRPASTEPRLLTTPPTDHLAGRPAGVTASRVMKAFLPWLAVLGLVIAAQRAPAAPARCSPCRSPGSPGASTPGYVRTGAGPETRRSGRLIPAGPSGASRVSSGSGPACTGPPPGRRGTRPAPWSAR